MPRVLARYSRRRCVSVYGAAIRAACGPSVHGHSFTRGVCMPTCACDRGHRLAAHCDPDGKGEDAFTPESPQHRPTATGNCRAVTGSIGLPPAAGSGRAEQRDSQHCCGHRHRPARPALVDWLCSHDRDCCRFVMLIDSPVFTRVRLQLLSPGRYPDLMRAMHSLLMLCPQSRAFHTLHARLSSVPTLALLKLNDDRAEHAAASGGTAALASSPGGASPAASSPHEFDMPPSPESNADVHLPWGDMLQVCASEGALLGHDHALKAVPLPHACFELCRCFRPWKAAPLGTDLCADTSSDRCSNRSRSGLLLLGTKWRVVGALRFGNAAAAGRCVRARSGRNPAAWEMPLVRSWPAWSTACVCVMRPVQVKVIVVLVCLAARIWANVLFESRMASDVHGNPVVDNVKFQGYGHRCTVYLAIPTCAGFSRVLVGADPANAGTAITAPSQRVP